MMPDLPQELVYEILSRVPATSLKRLRATCKQWNSLFTDTSFTEKHFRKAPKQSLVFMLKEYMLFSTNVNLNVVPPSIEFEGGPVLKDSCNVSVQQHVDIAEVFHCEGLLLCTTKDSRLVLWNPCSTETRWIQLKPCSSRTHNFALGYKNNNNSSRSYKILRYWSHYRIDGPILCSQVYDLTSNTLGVVNEVEQITYTTRLKCFSLKGNTYWLASHSNGHGIILCFDYTTERFKRLSLPPSDQVYDWMGPSCVGEERISVLKATSGSSKIEMWVTSRIVTSEAALSWSKYLCLDDHNGYHVPTSLLIDDEKKVVLCCSIGVNLSGNEVYTIGEEGQYYKAIPFLQDTTNEWWRPERPYKPWFPHIFSYVPSLVQIQQCM